MKPQLEVVPHSLDSSVEVFEYTGNCFDAPWHYHNELELTYITQSNGIRYVGSSIENFQEGDLVLIGSGLPHAWKNAPYYDKGASSVYIQWNEDIFSDFFKGVSELNATKVMLEKANCGIYFKSSVHTHSIGEKLQKVTSQKGAERILAFLNILCELSLVQEFELLSEPSHHILPSQETDNRIRDIFVFIDSNYKRKITVDEMANLTYMTKPSFCKFFKSRFNKTFTQYLNEFRIYNVCHELQATTHSINHIAMESGYENMAYFHRQFKHIIGMTPSSYRKKHMFI